MDMTIEEVDALTGATLGWPKTGTFRLSDMVGIDVLANVAKNFFERVKDERSDIVAPTFLSQMLERKWLEGDKTGQGFYKKVKGEVAVKRPGSGLENSRISRLRQSEVSSPRNGEERRIRCLSDLKLILAGDPKKDRAAAFYWQILPDLWNYAAHRIPEIADDIVCYRSSHEKWLQLGTGAFRDVGRRRCSANRRENALDRCHPCACRGAIAGKRQDKLKPYADDVGMRHPAAQILRPRTTIEYKARPRC